MNIYRRAAHALHRRGTRLLRQTLFTLALLAPVAARSAGRGETLTQQPQTPATFTVTGQVFDNAKNPLPGVTVTLKGDKSRAAVTDVDGNYRITVPDGQTARLLFTFLGMETKEVPVRKQPRLNIILEPGSVALQDVEIVGAYGTVQKRADLVSSAYQVNEDQMKNLPLNRIDNLLDGLVPGLKIDINTDVPSSTRPRYDVRIRGESSLSASNEPLWVLDGTPIYTGERTNQVIGMNYSISPLSFINPEDIASITVLKDASATAIYGANGSNGVILVTTKGGTSGKPQFNVSARYGVSHVNNGSYIKMLNAEQYMELAKESFANSGYDMKYFPFQDNELNAYSTTATNWKDEFFSLGHYLEAGLSARGGNDRAKYYLSGNYYRDQSTVKGNLGHRITFRGNNEVKLHRKLSLTLNFSAAYNINDLFVPSDYYYQSLPIYSPYDLDGVTRRLYNKYIDNTKMGGDPVWKTVKYLNYVAYREENDNRQRAFLANLNLLLKYDIIKGLRYTGQFGTDFNSNFEDTYSARSNWSSVSLDTGLAEGYATRAHSNIMVWTTVHRLNYDTKIGKHAIGGVFGYEMSSKSYSVVSASGEGFVNDHIKEISYAATRRGSSSASIKHSMSLFLQGSYSWDGRYFVVLNGRRDGDSDFGTDVRWGNFGSLGLSWNIHNEPFFSSSVIDILKLKGSYGVNGNSRLGSQTAMGLYTYSESSNYNGQSGAVVSSVANPQLSWESTYATNLGLRIKLFNRLDIETELYNNITRNLISQLDVTQTTGDTRVYRNMGSIRNRGIEVTITSENLKGPFTWVTDLNMTHNQNRILELYHGTDISQPPYVRREGYDINTFNLVRWVGVDPRDGNPLWLDADGNVTRAYTIANRIPVGNSTPKLTGGMTNTFGYGDFSLRVMLNYTIGGLAYGNLNSRGTTDGRSILSQNQSVNQLDRWQKPGDLALNPKPSVNNETQSTMTSTRQLFSKTHLRLQNIALSYNFPLSVVKKLNMKGFQLSLILDNVGVWTPYDKKDRNSYRQLMRGYPWETVYSLNANISF
ncbi:MAG: SusC/RagA family TonB-linked outer membrane protein [Coprobacter sp.]|nr:SusC/RagA family TonB-linked outer membrane protein [Coprobacter sp.]